MQSYMLLAGDELPEVTKVEKPLLTLPLAREWYFDGGDDNALTLDTCQYILGDDEEYSEPRNILDIMEILLSQRANDKLKLRFTFEIDGSAQLESMKSLRLVSELTDEFSISVNGSKAVWDGVSWWKDKAFKSIDIKQFVKTGVNEIIVDGSFFQRQKVYDVLFGENWNNQDIDLKTRSIITVVALMSSGVTDSSLKYHLANAKAHGVTQKEIAAVIAHTAFYVGWPKGWAVFNLAKEVWQLSEGDAEYDDPAMRAHAKQMVFPIGASNDAYAQYFIGQSYLAPLSTQQVGIFNVTFEPGCRNNWHVHNADAGGGQILLCVAGRGYYQEWGKDAVEMSPGDCVNIAPGVKHWHGAAPDSWFSHLAVEVPGENGSSEWLEAVTDEQYNSLG